jgi:hypothetical protein
MCNCDCNRRLGPQPITDEQQQEMTDRLVKAVQKAMSKMPHDANGKLVQVGDLVNVPCKVTSVAAGDEYCNVTLQTVHSMPPYTDHNTITLNTKQVVKQ